MSKGTIGAVTAVLAFFAAAATAEAQGIDVTITGPSNIPADATSMTVTADVNTAGFMYWIKVKHNGTQKHYSSIKSTPNATISYVVGNMGSWGIVEDDTIEISVRVWTSSTNYDLDIEPIIVGPPSYYGFVPADDRRLPALEIREGSYARLSREDLGVNA